jgi:hypothetical protein
MNPQSWTETKKDFWAIEGLLREYEQAAFFPLDDSAAEYAAAKATLEKTVKRYHLAAAAAWISTLRGGKCFHIEYPVKNTFDDVFASREVNQSLGELSLTALGQLLQACSGAADSIQTELAARLKAEIVRQASQEVLGRPPETLVDMLRVRELLLRSKADRIELPVAVKIISTTSSIPPTVIVDDVSARSTPQVGLAEITITHGACEANSVVADRRTIPSTRLVGYQAVENPEYRAAEFSYQKALFNYRAAVDQANNMAPSADALTASITSAAIAYDLNKKKRAVDDALEAFRQTAPTLQKPVFENYEFSGERVDVERSCIVIVALRETREAMLRMAVLRPKDSRSFVLFHGIDPSDKDGAKSVTQYAHAHEQLDSWRSGSPSILLSTLADVFQASRETNHSSISDFVAAIDAALVPPPTTTSESASADTPVATALRSTVAIETSSALGSGFIAENNIVITNAHVVGSENAVTVTLSTGSKIQGYVVRKDVGRDIAAIRVNTNLTPLSLYRGQVAPATEVLAIGSPLDSKFFNTITRGIVSGCTSIVLSMPFSKSIALSIHKSSS